MSFNKETLKKVASEIRGNGVTSSYGKELRKKASDTRIAFLTAVIKQPYQ